MRLFLTILLAKTISFITKTLKIGGGSAAPGLYALKIDPSLVSKLSNQIPVNIIITGTNGKTTTARLLNHFLITQNKKVIRNSTGSNLERGIASALLNQANIFGRIVGVDFGIWELDEAAFNKVVTKLKPKIIVFLNAFRDQLDRYGEVDTVIKNWQKSLENIDFSPLILINASDGNLASLAKIDGLKVNVFAVQEAKLKWEKSSVLSPNRFSDSFEAVNLSVNGLKGTTFSIKKLKQEITLPLPGVYHVFDFLAALLAYHSLGLPVTDAIKSLHSFSPAFGRVEEIEISGKQAYIFLIKNPAGATSVFETLSPVIKPDDKLLLILNDNFADGTDVSWIWDAEFEKLFQSEKLKVICSGKRAFDLALRLKYSGYNPADILVEPDLIKAIHLSVNNLNGRLFILPTYTALLSIQHHLAKSGSKNFYWKDS